MPTPHRRSLLINARRQLTAKLWPATCNRGQPGAVSDRTPRLLNVARAVWKLVGK